MPEWFELEALHSRVTPAGAAGEPQPRGEVAALRRATRTKCPLGEPGFVEELEIKFQVRLRTAAAGASGQKTGASQGDFCGDRAPSGGLRWVGRR